MGENRLPGAARRVDSAQDEDVFEGELLSVWRRKRSFFLILRAAGLSA